MRADRLVALILLLRQGGRLSATEIADRLEVSTRTVLRDIEALSGAGVPVYAERGRHGGFALLPGFRAELTGLGHDETLALLVSGIGRDSSRFGLGTALATALLKVVDALPPAQQQLARDAATRLLAEPDHDLLDRRRVGDAVEPEVMVAARRAVVEGRKLRLEYTPTGGTPASRVIDPIGIVTADGRPYVLATRDGADRTYRLSRASRAEVLDVAADRPADVDLAALWRARSAAFIGPNRVRVTLRAPVTARQELIDSSLAIEDETVTDGVIAATVLYQDDQHAEWALWRLGPDAEALEPAALRARLAARATALAERYRDSAKVTCGDSERARSAAPASPADSSQLPSS